MPGSDIAALCKSTADGGGTMVQRPFVGSNEPPVRMNVEEPIPTSYKPAIDPLITLRYAPTRQRVLAA
jgi:hypothetical protein